MQSFDLAPQCYLLQMARGAIDDTIRDCSTGQLRVKPHRLSGSPGPVGGVERRGWTRIPNRLDRRSASFETPPAAAPQDKGASRRTQDGDAALRLNFLPSLDSVPLVGITGLTR
jgi:hypothetical protein